MEKDGETGAAALLGGYRLEDQVGFLLRLAGQRHAAIFSRLMPGGLTPTQFAALVRLAAAGALPQNELGRLTAMDVATIKGVVDRLRRRGLVASSPDPADARRHSIVLTDAGRALLADAIPAARTITAETLEGLDTEEISMLLSLLRRLG